MIKRDARRSAAQLVRRFRECEITNFEFENDWPVSREDLALRAIGTMLWSAYDDHHEHRLEGRHALTDDGRQLFDRCALFLASDHNYEWPEHNFLGIAGLGPWFRVLTLGFSWLLDQWIERRHHRFRAMLEAAGDFDVWPFLRRRDYEMALQHAATEA
jgi:hypothetical protein